MSLLALDEFPLGFTVWCIMVALNGEPKTNVRQSTTMSSNGEGRSQCEIPFLQLPSLLTEFADRRIRLPPFALGSMHPLNYSPPWVMGRSCES